MVLDVVCSIIVGNRNEFVLVSASNPFRNNFQVSSTALVCSLKLLNGVGVRVIVGSRIRTRCSRLFLGGVLDVLLRFALGRFNMRFASENVSVEPSSSLGVV